jgi:hypothetical protein
MQLADARVSERPLFSERDQWFESAFLQRGVSCEPKLPRSDRQSGLTGGVSRAIAKVGSTFAGRQRRDRMLRFAHAHEPQQDLRSKHLGNQPEGVVGILVIAAMLALFAARPSRAGAPRKGFYSECESGC